MESKPANKLNLPITALAFSIAPLVSILLVMLHHDFLFLLLLTILAPLFGLIMGIIALSRGKNQIGIAGAVIAGIAVALPVVFIAVILATAASSVVIIGM
ncbi:MAG: hypothetical protein FWC93_07475 [Defluviitaleaceae bacterium]|nr:hypothetical protein [Defluviitaleaceae bacterium]